MIARPQPIGVFPYPAGLLLLPATDDAQAAPALAELLRGATPSAWPSAWHFAELVWQDQRDAALDVLAVLPGPVPAYNRFVLSGTREDRDVANLLGDDALGAMTELAAFTMGMRDTLPSLDALDGELRAHALLVQAAYHIEHHDVAGATRALDEGLTLARVSSPLLAAHLLTQRADLAADGPADTRLTWLREAAELAAGGALPSLSAELHLRLGTLLHEQAASNRGRLVEAINAYQAVLRCGVTIDSAPDTFALVQNNLGLAYAAMPMTSAGDKLRLAVAVQSFREALKVYTRESHPDAWASTMLNMANALQYLPSSHPQENLIEAVNTYEELLSVRTRAYDPAGYARLLANQANALSHLGMFQPALEKFNEAHKLLHWHGEPQAAQELLDQVERVNQQLASAGASAERER